MAVDPFVRRTRTYPQTAVDASVAARVVLSARVLRGLRQLCAVAGSGGFEKRCWMLGATLK